jgi:hypothetical protein
MPRETPTLRHPSPPLSLADSVPFVARVRIEKKASRHEPYEAAGRQKCDRLPAGYGVVWFVHVTD